MTDHNGYKTITKDYQASMLKETKKSPQGNTPVSKKFFLCFRPFFYISSNILKANKNNKKRIYNKLSFSKESSNDSSKINYLMMKPKPNIIREAKSCLKQPIISEENTIYNSLQNSREEIMNINYYKKINKCKKSFKQHFNDFY